MPAANLAALRARIAAAVADFLGPEFRGPVVVEIRTETGEAHTLRLLPPGEDAGNAGSEGTSAGSADNAPGAPADENSEENSGDGKTPQQWEASIRNSPVARQVLDGADLTPRESIEIAQEAGAQYNGRWRYWVAVLVRLGYLERHPRTKKLRKLKDLDDE